MTVYREPPNPTGPTRSAQGKRCPRCGQPEADPWAQFCGVCGSSLADAGAAPAGATTRVPPVPGVPAQYDPGAPAPYAPPAAPPTPYQAPAPGPAGAIDYTIPSVWFAGPARIGAAVSAAFMLIPCVLFGFLGAWLIHTGRTTLDAWLNGTVRVPVPVVSVDLTMNFVELLHMRPLHNLLIYWDDRLWLAFAIIWLAPWALFILAGALFALLLASIYNVVGSMGGGMRVSLRPSQLPPAGPGAGAPPSWQGQGQYQAQSQGQYPGQQPGWSPERPR